MNMQSLRQIVVVSAWISCTACAGEAYSLSGDSARVIRDTASIPWDAVRRNQSNDWMFLSFVPSEHNKALVIVENADGEVEDEFEQVSGSVSLLGSFDEAVQPSNYSYDWRRKPKDFSGSTGVGTKIASIDPFVDKCLVLCRVADARFKSKEASVAEVYVLPIEWKRFVGEALTYFRANPIDHTSRVLYADHLNPIIAIAETLKESVTEEELMQIIRSQKEIIRLSIFVRKLMSMQAEKDFPLDKMSGFREWIRGNTRETGIIASTRGVIASDDLFLLAPDIKNGLIEDLARSIETHVKEETLAAEPIAVKCLEIAKKIEGRNPARK